MSFNVDLSAYAEKAQQVMDSFRKGPGELKAAVAMLSPDELAGVYHYLHDEGGLGRLEGNVQDQIKSGALQLKKPEYINAAIALRVLMDQKPGAHQSRIGMVDSPHEPVDPSKYIGGSPMIDKHVKMGRQAQGLKEGRKVFTLSEVKEMIREELKVVMRTTNNSGHMYLFESKSRKVKRVKFELMMERYDKGTISGDTLAKQWTKSTLYELNRLEEELIKEVDWEKRSAEIEAGDVEGGGRYDPEGRPAPGMGAMAKRAGAEISSAMQKLNDFAIEKAVQAVQLASTSWSAVKSAAEVLSKAAERFREKHPILYKIIKMIVMALVVFAIYKLTQGEAQAAIGAPADAPGVLAPGGVHDPKTLTSGEVNAMIGNLRHHLGEATKAFNLERAGEIKAMISDLRDAHESTKVVPLEKLGKLSELLWNQTREMIEAGKSGDQEAFKLVIRWAKIGKSLIVQ